MGEYFHKITVCDSKDMDKNNEFGCSLILKKMITTTLKQRH